MPLSKHIGLRRLLNSIMAAHSQSPLILRSHVRAARRFLLPPPQQLKRRQPKQGRTKFPSSFPSRSATVLARERERVVWRCGGGAGRSRSSNPAATESEEDRKMVVLVVATTKDPASIGPAAAFLAMPGWSPGPPIAEGMESFTNGNVRLLKHERSIIEEDNLDQRWQEATGEPVSEVIFLSKHTAVSNRPALTVHPIGVPHLRDDETPPQGGIPGWAAIPNPRIGPWLRLMQKIAAEQGLVPEFEITLEATHHGPVTSTPTMFVEIGSTEEYWGRQDAAQAIALVLRKGLGLEDGNAIGSWQGNGEKVLLGIGGGHYAPRHMDIVNKDGVWVGHLLSGYSLPMDAPSQVNGKTSGEVAGMWKHSIKVSYEATKAAFPGGEVIAHLDHKSFKGWQKNAVTSYLQEQNIRIGKPSDFF